MEKLKILLACADPYKNYVEALEGLGAEPTPEYLPEVDTSYDGLILCGGSDIDPKYYGEPMDGSVNIDLERDKAEFALLKAYVEAGKPVFGICRGLQLINIFFGGTLHQDIPEADLHKKINGVDSVHNVTAKADSILGKVYGETFAVNSAHHQAIKDLGAGLRATARWNDRYIEGIEHKDHPIFAVQWHPERMCFNNKREDTVNGAEILQYFLNLCQTYRK